MKDSKTVRRPSSPGRISMTELSELSSQSQRILALLVSRSRSAEPTITYAEIAKQIGVHVCNLKHPMDHLSRALASYAASRGLRIPPLQILVVNGKTGLPGPGASAHISPPYVKKGEQYGTANKARQREIANAIFSAISEFPNWDRVEEDLALLL